MSNLVLLDATKQYTAFLRDSSRDWEEVDKELIDFEYASYFLVFFYAHTDKYKLSWADVSTF